MTTLARTTPSFGRIGSASNCQTSLSSKTHPGLHHSQSPESSSDTINPDSPTSSLKPLNIFYIWYYELCRRQNTHPLPSITHGSSWHNNQILDFTADRVKLEDWQPIVNALRLDMSLHVICVHSRLAGQKLLEYADTEERVKKIKRWFGTICTKYILKNLLKAISSCLKTTQVLTCLELDGLQINGEYLTMIIKALLVNKSIKYLSFKGCPILDEGCQEICDALHQMPNIEILNLASCGLGVKSGECLGKVIKYQQINRYCESWHSSLRYEDPVVSNMAGLKRLTLNNNVGLGDAGTEMILQELVDDLWIRALDMQRCGVTQRLATRIIDLLQYSRSLRIVDFRRNQLLPATIAQILEMLKEKKNDDEDQEFQWCYTSTSLDTASYGTYISLVNPKTPSKHRQFRPKPIKPNNTSISNIALPSTAITTKKPSPTNNQKVTKEKINTTLQKPENSNLMKAKEQLMQLYEKLKDETQKRQKAEKKCEELQKRVDELLAEQKNQEILKEFTNMKQYISKFISFVKEHGDFEEREPIIRDLQNALEEVQILAKSYESPNGTPRQSVLFNSPVNSSMVDVNSYPDPDYTAADLKLQTIFQSLLGPSVPSVESSDFELSSLSDLVTAIDMQAVDESSPHDQIGSTCSSDSDSVETLKRLLEELGQDDEEGWCTEEMDTVSDPTSPGTGKL